MTNLSLNLSAENADNFRNVSIEKSGKIEILLIFNLFYRQKISNLFIKKAEVFQNGFFVDGDGFLLN